MIRNGLKNAALALFLSFSAMSSATPLQQVLMDQESYEEVAADKTNYSTVATAAHDFCTTEFTDSSTYADAPPPGVIFACNEDALAEMFVSWFDYPRLEKMFALNGGEKSAYGKMAASIGFTQPSLKAVNIAKDNVVIWNVINSILNYFIGIMFLFITVSFFNEARKLNSEFGLQNSMDAVVGAAKKQWLKIISLLLGMLLLTGFPIYIVILLSGLINFGAYLFFDPLDEQGVIDTTTLDPLKESESVKYSNLLLQSSLEGGQTAQYFLNTVDYQSEIDKNWSVFNYDDPTKEQVFHFVEGLNGAFNAKASMDNVWFSDLEQVEEICFGFDDTYENAGLDILFDFVENTEGKNCFKPVDKTNFDVLMPDSSFVSGFGSGHPLVEGVAEYAVSLELGDSIANAVIVGNKAGVALVDSYDEIFNMAKNSIRNGGSVYDTTTYQNLVLSFASQLEPAIKDVKDEDITTEDQQVFKALIANSAKEAMLGLQIASDPPVPSSYLTGKEVSVANGEDLYGDHSTHVLTQLKKAYSDSWYEYKMSEGCYESKQKELVYKDRQQYVNEFNSYPGGMEYNDITSENGLMKAHNSEIRCVVYNADGTKRVLGASTEAEAEEVVLNKKAAELATRILPSLAFDASVEAYNRKISEDSFIKEELQYFKRGFFGLFLNLSEKAKNQDKLGRLNSAFTYYTFTDSSSQAYEKDTNYDYVLQDVVGNYDESGSNTYKLRASEILSVNNTVTDGDSDKEEIENSTVQKVIDFLFEDYFYQCLTPVNPNNSDFNSTDNPDAEADNKIGYACADPTYHQVMMTAPKAIPASVQIITYYLIFAGIGSVDSGEVGAALSKAGPGGWIAKAISLLASTIKFILMPLYVIALYLILMSILGLILTAFIPISIVIDVVYSVLYFVFGVLLLVVYVVPFSSLLGNDNEIGNTLKKIIMKLMEPIFTVTIILFYYFQVSGYVNGLFGSIVFDLLIGQGLNQGTGMIAYAMLYSLNVVLQLTMIFAVFTIKDLAIISSIRSLVPELIGTKKSAELGYMEARSIFEAPNKMGQTLEKNLNAEKIAENTRGMTNKAKGAVGSMASKMGKKNENS